MREQEEPRKGGSNLWFIYLRALTRLVSRLMPKKRLEKPSGHVTISRSDDLHIRRLPAYGDPQSLQFSESLQETFCIQGDVVNGRGQADQHLHVLCCGYSRAFHFS